jgi:hypothetical protein
MTTNGNDEIAQWEKFTRDALHLAGHSDAQIDAMRAKAIEDAKPKPRVVIPWVPVPKVDWDKYYADEASKKATKAHQDRLAVAHRATEVERARAEEAEAKVRELNRAMDDGSH